MRVFNAVRDKFLTLTKPADILSKEGIDLWRERIYARMLRALLVFGLLAAIPSIWLSLSEGLYGLAIFDAVAYLYILLLAVLRNSNYTVRAVLLVLVGFMVGVVVFFEVGLAGAGLLWLFVAPPIAGLLIGLPWGVAFLGLNALFVAGTTYLVGLDLDTLPGLAEFTVVQWLVVGLNFLVTNAIVTLPLGALLEGLFSTAERERGSREFAMRVIGSSNALVIQTDRRGRILHINPSAEKITGYELSELAGHRWDTLIPQDQLPDEWERFNQAARERRIPESVEFPIIAKNGETRHIVWQNTSVSDPNNPIAMVSFGIDITARMEAARALKDAYRQLDVANLFNESVLSTSPVGIIVYEAENGQCVLANHAAHEIVGAAPDQLLEQDFREIASWKPSGMLDAAEKVLSTGQSQTLTTSLTTTFGKPISMYCTFSTWNPGGTEHLLLTFTDVSELQAAKESLERRVGELQAINRVSSALRAANRLEDMLPPLLEATLETVGLQAGAIWLYDKSSDELRVEVMQGYSQPGQPPPEIPPEKPGTGLASSVFVSGQVHASEDYSQEQGIPEFIRQRIPAGVGGVSVPIHSEDEIIGVLVVNTMTPQTLDEGQINLLITLAEIAGSAIHRRQLYQQTETHLQHLLALSQIDQAIMSNDALMPTLQTILENVVRELAVDASIVLLYDPETQRLESVATHGFNTDTFDNRFVRLGAGNAGRIALERTSLYIQNLNEGGANPHLVRALEKENFVSYYGLPLISKGEIKGVLEIFHRTQLDPSPEWVDFLNALAGQTAIAVDNATLFENLRKSNLDLATAYDAAIEGWSRALDLRDKETEGHTRRVADLTMLLATRMGVDEAELVHMQRGALLHDIGKMGIPDSILLKTGTLDEDEWEVMRKHPIYAYEMLRPMASLKKALHIPWCHHEKWDGSGYPRGLKGEEIPRAARIFAVADVYDALTSDRPYRKAWSEERALEYIREQSGQHFDPEVVAAFLELVGREAHVLPV